MEDLERPISAETAIIHLLPEVKDILDLQVTGQLLLIKPLEIALVKTKTGIILEGGAQTEAIKNTVLQKGVIVNVGSKITDLKPGMAVLFFKASVQGRLIRQGTDVYVIMAEYDIHAYIKA